MILSPLCACHHSRKFSTAVSIFGMLQNTSTLWLHCVSFTKSWRSTFNFPLDLSEASALMGMPGRSSVLSIRPAWLLACSALPVSMGTRDTAGGCKSHARCCLGL